MLGALALCAASVASAQTLEYDCTVLPGQGSRPHATASRINGKGHIVGMSTRADDRSVATLWKGTRLIDLSLTLSGPVRSSYAAGLNDRGQVAGTVALDCGQFCQQLVPVLWQDGQSSELPLLPNVFNAEAVDINNKGRIIGSMQIDSVPHAVLWRDGQPIDLGALGDEPAKTHSEALSINAANVVAGWSYGGEWDFRSHAVIWDPAGRIKDLGTLPGGSSAKAFSVNVAGTVVGISDRGGQSSDTVPHATAWQDGVAYDIGSLVAGNRTYPQAINDGGTVVGEEDMGGYSKAVLWRSIHEPAQELQKLVAKRCSRERGYSIERAVDINNDGTIVATGTQDQVGPVVFRLVPRN